MPAPRSAQSSGSVPYNTQHVNDALLDAWYARVPPTTYNMNNDSLLAMKRIPWNDGKYRSDLEDIVHVYIRNEEKCTPCQRLASNGSDLPCVYGDNFTCDTCVQNAIPAKFCDAKHKRSKPKPKVYNRKRPNLDFSDPETGAATSSGLLHAQQSRSPSATTDGATSTNNPSYLVSQSTFHTPQDHTLRSSAPSHLSAPTQPPSLPTPNLLNAVPSPSPSQSTSARRPSELTSPFPSLPSPHSSTLLNPDPLLAILRERAASARRDAITKRNKARVADLEATVSEHEAQAYEKAVLEQNIEVARGSEYRADHEMS
ncbi:hypothetical protein PHLCEN_2v1988 [Hermanssonia centrifuga]|uniref:Uncharacterized protein n=1 Tax=Hermanssonia centrifuga TaxID=98765 RepID=A0A2R6RQF0_9APHY|nr:hypothetical protein PHLCEN_2v1988 [Hermanssonia centrifuga]